MYNRKFVLLLFPVALMSLLVFQNCSDQAFVSKNEDARSAASVVNPDIGQMVHTVEIPKLKSEVQPLYASRMLVFNIYRSIFGTSIENELIERIAWASAEFGSGEDYYAKVYAKDCKTKRSPYYVCDNRTLKQNTSSVVGISATREGRRISACHAAIDSTLSLEHAFNKIEPGTSMVVPPQASQANFKRIFQLFFRGKPIDRKSVV